MTQEAGLMTVAKAFSAFAFRLELKEEEERSAELHRLEIMMILPQWFAVERSFYGGSFARRTFAKPITDADLFIELGHRNLAYRSRCPSAIIRAFRNILAISFVPSRMSKWHGGLRIDYGRYQEPVPSINLVPILAEGDAWAIPDRQADRWLVTDPHRHDALAQRAHSGFPQRWRTVVQMAKCWNNQCGTPVMPAFLLEVFALEYLKSGLYSSYDYQIYGLFEELTKRLSEEWADPAGLGPPISAVMTPEQRDNAVQMALRAQSKAHRAITSAQNGDIDAALARYRELFGPLFPVK